VPGSIRMVRDKDTLELRVYVGRDESGRVRHRHATFHGSKREAERALARLVADVDATRTSTMASAPRAWGEQTTINDAIAGWQANGWDDLSPSTTRRYQSIWATHIKRIRAAHSSGFRRPERKTEIIRSSSPLVSAVLTTSSWPIT
jgi:hypothetical protein